MNQYVTHLFIDRDTRCMLPWAERHPWVVVPGLAIAFIASITIESANEWVLLLTHCGTMVATGAGAYIVVKKAFFPRRFELPDDLLSRTMKRMRKRGKEILDETRMPFKNWRKK